MNKIIKMNKQSELDRRDFKGGLGANLMSNQGANGKKAGFESSSAASLSSSYKVPSRDEGRFLLAMPLKLCLKFRPPTIAVVYKLDPLSGMGAGRTLPTNSKSLKKYEKKYIHEVFVEKMTRNTNLQALCDKLCEQEAYYLNPTIISKSQVSPCRY